jgi:hypothetical protein
MVLRSPPDGHTLLFGTSGSLALAPALSKLPYDVFTDLAPVTLVVINPQILVVHPSLPVRTVPELVKLAKSKPGQINYASVGPGSPNHMGMELLKSMTGIDMVHIPYKGTTPAMSDVISGQVSLLFNSMPSVLPHVRSGRLRALAVGSAKRSPAAPDVPTVSETPGLQGFQYTTWYALLAPAATPKDVVNQISAESGRALSQPDMSELLASQGAEPIDWLGNVPGGQMTTGMGRVPSVWEGRASVRQRKKASPSKWGGGGLGEPSSLGRKFRSRTVETAGPGSDSSQREAGSSGGGSPEALYTHSPRRARRGGDVGP